MVELASGSGWVESWTAFVYGIEGYGVMAIRSARIFTRWRIFLPFFQTVNVRLGLIFSEICGFFVITVIVKLTTICMYEFEASMGPLSIYLSLFSGVMKYGLCSLRPISSVANADWCWIFSYRGAVPFLGNTCPCSHRMTDTISIAWSATSRSGSKWCFKIRMVAVVPSR